MRFRFGLRSLVVLVTVVCIALWAIPVAMEWYKWRLIRGVVFDTLNQIAASPDKPSVFMGTAWHSDYVLANVEINWNSKTASGAPVTTTPQNGAVFVEMPGKVHTWAHSPDEVMQLIREND